MPKEKETAPGGRKSELLKDDDILDFAEEILGSADEEILELEDVDEASEEEEDIIDLTEVAGYEVGNQDEEEILDLTDELEDVPDDEVLDLDEVSPESEADAAAPNTPDEAATTDSTEEEDILELDDVVADEEPGGFDIEEDIFDLDVEEGADSEAGSLASSFTIEADTIELSEADRRSLEEEFSFEPEPAEDAREETPASAGRQDAARVEDHEPEVELISVMPADNDDPWNTAERQSRASSDEDESDEETEEIVLDFGESEEESTAPAEAFYGTFDSGEQPVSAESATPVESAEPEADTASQDLEPAPQTDAAEPDEPTVQEFMGAAEEGEVHEFSEPGRDEAIYAVDDFTGDAALEEPREITIEEDETDEEDAFTWTDETETAAAAKTASWTAQTDESDAFEEKALEPEAAGAQGPDVAWEPAALEPRSDREPLPGSGPEETDAPLSTEAIFADDEMMEDDGSDYAVSPTSGSEELPEEGGMGVDFTHAEAFEEKDMHRVADPISVRVKEPSDRSDDHADEDDLLNRVFDNESPAISTERLESIVEETVNRIFAEKIETILVDAIERAVTREIERLKQLVLGGEE